MKKLLSMSFLFAALLAFTQSSTVEAQIVSGPPVAINKLPDLIVNDIIFETPTKVRVSVLNQGKGGSSSCYLALITEVKDAAITTKQRVWTIEIPALAAGKEFSNTIDVAPLTFSQGPWRALVDRSNTVKESDESNNQRKHFTYGGSVNAPMPDLQITAATLVDATTGEVSVEISNTGAGAAPSSKLRLIVWKMGKFEQQATKQVFVKVPAIEGLQKTTVKIKTGVPIISTKYSLFIDIGEQVKEKNEKNNWYEGEAGKS